MLWRKPPEDLAKVGVEGSNPFARSNDSLKSLIGRRFPGGPSRSLTQNRTCRHAPNAGKFREAGFPSVPVNSEHMACPAIRRQMRRLVRELYACFRRRYPDRALRLARAADLLTEGSRARPPPVPLTVDKQAYRTGRDMLHQARALFERALQINSTDVDALNGTAFTYFLDFINGWGDPGTDYDAKVLGQANRAINLAPDYANAYPLKAIYSALSRRAKEALGSALD